ncbi:2-hydroxy-3-oxopropionate reductase [Lamprobacter modestohalophilus]|uniref:2-hydroxy-3-oxopropionate reductase n=1 Tax=Lamprobacter modestohalophilus TaxID=1064514 RepID=UPI002ADEAA74|nr:2-hydroxy-3-oxopropionate reductase [Lamprobacter modestohalophilus]MEA1050180.1 2-hydroxy-3-oxopropionate reductase [Lamprobacter modestohalophilus]
MTETIGFIGLGIMGRPIALNLINAGYRLAVHARREASMQPLLEAGAEPCSSPAEVARRSAILFTMVSDTPDVEQVILGAQGVIEGVQAGAIVIDMSTISPSATRAMAERLRAVGAEMLDAPVSGGDIGAAAGTLSIMVGGPEVAFERVRPLFEVMGQNIVHVGDHGAGQVCKACNQVLVAQTIAGVGEAMLLAKASGVDPDKVREALLGGFANSRVLEVHGRRMLEDDYAPGFKAALHQKDMRIVLEAAHELGLGLPGAAQAAQWLNALVGQGLGDLDSAAIYKIQAQFSLETAVDRSTTDTNP